MTAVILWVLGVSAFFSAVYLGVTFAVDARHPLPSSRLPQWRKPVRARLGVRLTFTRSDVVMALSATFAVMAIALVTVVSVSHAPAQPPITVMTPPRIGNPPQIQSVVQASVAVTGTAPIATAPVRPARLRRPRV